MQWTKQVASHFGGTRNGMVISWPARIKDKGTIRTQFAHIIDIVPTIYEATGLIPPTMMDGVQQTPLEGTSLVYTFEMRPHRRATPRSISNLSATAPSTRTAGWPARHRCGCRG